MSNKSDASTSNRHPAVTDEIIEKCIQALELEDIRSWKKEAQEAYVRARLKARANQPKEGSYSHWDLF